MLSVGLTGGLATGKSFVGRTLESLGCVVIRADELGHQVLLPGAEAYDATVQEFGPGILNADGTIDRRKLATEVFDKPERLARLNSLVHPAVRARTARMTAEAVATDPAAIIVNEAAILIETGSYKDFDRLIVTICQEEQQIERAMDRDGLTRDQVLTRLRRQMPLQEKARFAHYVIDTSGPKENTLEQTRAVYRSLRSISI